MEIIVALVSLFGVLITIIVNTIIVTKKLNSDLDFSTDWRKNLSQIAGKSEVTLEDVYTVRAKLRFSKKEENSEYVKVMNYIIDELEKMIKKGKSELIEEDKKKIRLICMYLLKIQWEYRGFMLPRNKCFKKILSIRVNTYSKEFYSEFDKIEGNTGESSMNKENKENIEMKNEREFSTDIKSYSKAEKNRTGRLLDYLCNIAKLIIFLTMILSPLFIIHYLKFSLNWKDIVMILLVGLFSLLYLIIEKE